MKQWTLGTIVLMLALVPFKASSEPTGGEVNINIVRPYAEGVIYVTVFSEALCQTSTFVIDTNVPYSKEMYAAALTAVASGKRVKLEVSNATECTGFATRLQSIFLLRD